MDLIIVESPSKAKTIEKYLGKKYMVDASGGHIRDLPEKTLGVDVKNDFEPKYVINKDKKDVIKRLAEKAKKADKVYLATDPDREGEAISWHLANVLKMDEKSNCRIEFNEISKTAVEKAITKPRAIDIGLVDAQQARRVLDRLVGYKLSPLLCKKIQDRLSAGRVQSVALRLIVEREREIQEFKPKEYWTLDAYLNKKQDSLVFKSSLALKNGKKFVPDNKEQMEAVLQAVKNNDFVVEDVKEGESYSSPSAPFTTSTMQQDASTRLGFPSPKTMLIAQQLYEGVSFGKEGNVALVTYIRTDSVRVSSEAIEKARTFIEKTYGEDYVPKTPNVYKTKKNAQDAHEAIRPISLEITPESVKGKVTLDQYKLYKLIYNRFLASQMQKAKFKAVKLDILNGEYTFKTTGKTLLFKGYQVIYNNEEEDDSSNKLPKLEKGEILDLNKLVDEQKFTKPPARYTDASLVKTMEQKGIGRPSTYASIISVIFKRKYVEKEGKNIQPTALGFSVNDMVVKYFDSIINTSFTAEMEEKLDTIEEGGIKWQDIVKEFYEPFDKKVKFAATDGDEVSDVVCDKCGSSMIIKNGRYGKYLACSSYPTCKNLISLEKAEKSEEKCPKCGADMLIKTGKFGKYLACENSECKFTKSLNEKLLTEKCPKCNSDLIEKAGPYGKYIACTNEKCDYKKPIHEKVCKCPKCDGNVIKRRSRTGKLFYGCDNYPKCDFVSWDLPLEEKCPKCNKFLVKKFTKQGAIIKCSSCDYVKEEIKEENE